jgi:hypothetical protein
MIIRIGFVLSVAALTAFAQETVEIRPLPPPPEGAAGATFQVHVAGPDVMFMSAEMGGAGKVVKGAPFSADVITEHNQVLADGTNIRNKQTGATYRDSEGRTRREQQLGAIGPLPVDPEMGKPVFINDPVAGANYVLETAGKTVRKLPVVTAEYAAGQRVMTHAPAGRTEYKRESLGTKVIEGVQAEGTRTVFTIAAGEIGNDRPIETVSERWYSPQLQVVVMSSHRDPRMGESTYRLANIKLAEQPRSLFEVPADYKVEVMEGPANFLYRRDAETRKILKNTNE